jgi:hypothetical protein
MPVPERIFIIPYRDRAQHKHFFATYMENILEDYDPSSYEIYYAHQKDDRPFNRGAMKNIGFMAMRERYPDHYRDITFVFNDVDILPYKKGIFAYDTVQGSVSHNYGYRNSLSASFAIKGGDFEKVNGFPNIWAWGYEDSIIQNRVIQHGLTIDRGSFRQVGHKDVLQLFDGIHRTLMKQRYKQIQADFAKDGISSIAGLRYDISGDMIDVHLFRSAHGPTSEVVTRHVKDLGVNASTNRKKVNKPLSPRTQSSFLM